MAHSTKLLLQPSCRRTRRDDAAAAAAAAAKAEEVGSAINEVVGRRTRYGRRRLIEVGAGAAK